MDNNNNDKSMFLKNSKSIYDFIEYVDIDIFERIYNNINKHIKDLKDNEEIVLFNVSNNQFNYYLQEFQDKYIYPEFNNIKDNKPRYIYSIYELYCFKIIFFRICNKFDKKISLFGFSTFLGYEELYFKELLDHEEYKYLVELDSYGNNINILKISLLFSLKNNHEQYYENLLTDNKSPLAPISVVNRLFEWNKQYIQDNNTIDTTNTSLYLERLKQESNS